MFLILIIIMYYSVHIFVEIQASFGDPTVYSFNVKKEPVTFTRFAFCENDCER